MKHFALIGENIAYSKSAVLHKAILDFAGAAGDYKIFSVERKRLPQVVERLKQGYDGFNITKPYKLDIVNYLDKNFSPTGAVNTVKIENGAMSGFNTDGEGFMRSLEYHGIDAAGKTVLILGAGGAARTIAYELDKISKVYIYNRTVETAKDIIKSLELKNTAIADLSRVAPHIVINATTLGLNGEMSLPNDVLLDNLKIVYDTIYNPVVTPVMEWALERKIKAYNGAAMLVFQALAAQKIWQGIQLEPNKHKILVDIVEGNK